MRKWMIAASAAAMAATGACTEYGYDRPGYVSDDYWDAPRYYRDGSYEERRLSHNDRVYRGRDGRYYCRRSDGSTGLIVGGVLGGIAGNVIAPGDSKTLGTVLGAVGGAVAGRAIERSDSKEKDGVRCR